MVKQISSSIFYEKLLKRNTTKRILCHPSQQTRPTIDDNHLTRNIGCGSILFIMADHSKEFSSSMKRQKRATMRDKQANHILWVKED